MPDKSDLSHLLLLKLRELSLHERTLSMLPSDKRIEIAGRSQACQKFGVGSGTVQRIARSE